MDWSTGKWIRKKQIEIGTRARRGTRSYTRHTPIISKPAASVLRHLSAGSWTVWGDAPTARVGNPKKLTAP